jgi:hypothetical protein
MFGRNKLQVVLEGPSCISLEQLEVQPTVDEALGAFRLVSVPYTVGDEDVVLAEKVQDIDNLHIHTDYIMHPVSAIRKTDDGRFSVEAIRAERIDDLINLYFNPRWAEAFFGELPKRYLTQDGWELFTLRGQEFLEVNSEPYKKCDVCHETMPIYLERDAGSLRPGEHWNRSILIQEKRTFKLKTPLQALLRKTGMVVTKIDHPCYHSLQELLRPKEAFSVDPPSLKPVFPKDISF